MKNTLKGLQFLVFMYLVVEPLTFLASKLQELFWYFSSAAMQERYWTYQEEKQRKAKK